MADDPIDALLKVVTVLEKLGIPYLVGGSFASSIHGIARSTKDVDILAAIKPEQADAFSAELQQEFYADEQTINRAVKAKQHFNLIHLDSMFKVDIFVAKLNHFELDQLKRRQLKLVHPESEQKVYISSPEDTILSKLVWYRRGNEISDQQWRDILGVVRVQADNLDVEYLKHWARELGVSDLLERALSE